MPSAKSPGLCAQKSQISALLLTRVTNQSASAWMATSIVTVLEAKEWRTVSGGAIRHCPAPLSRGLSARSAKIDRYRDQPKRPDEATSAEPGPGAARPAHRRSTFDAFAP